jgi:hypothetical protein
MTKVAYGGAYPITIIGKAFAAVFAIAAVGVVAMPTGILAAAFSDAYHAERQRRNAGNQVRNYNESVLIFSHVTSVIRFIESLESGVSNANKASSIEF